MIFILLFVFIVLILIYRKQIYNFVNGNKTEPFLDQYSLVLHEIASKKADWWNKTHGRNLYYYHNQVPQNYKE